VQPNFGRGYANAATLEAVYQRRRRSPQGGKWHARENVAPVLFPEGHPIGKDVMIDGSDFQVIGVVEKTQRRIRNGGRRPARADSSARFARSIYRPTKSICAHKRYPKMLDQAVDQIREVLERGETCRLGKDNFRSRRAEQQVEEFHNIVGKVALATVVLSSSVYWWAELA